MRAVSFSVTELQAAVMTAVNNPNKLPTTTTETSVCLCFTVCGLLGNLLIHRNKRTGIQNNARQILQF